VPEDSIDQSLRRIASGWQPPAAPPRIAWTPPADPARAQEAVEFSWSGETARHIGTVVHRWLQRIADDALKGWEPARVNALKGVFSDDLVASGLAADALEAATGRVAATIAQTLADERGRWLLGPRADAQSELRLTGAVGAGRVVNTVMDRTFVDEQEVRWIVDYKTGTHEGGDVEAFLDRERERYRPQLERYATLMRGLDRRPIRLGLYFPLLGGWREWAFDDRGRSCPFQKA
jgi:ATP-dependent exoDNAse (exonuclease V) beta subunit